MILTEDTAKTEELVKELASFIDDHKGEKTTVIDIGEQSSFTDYFIISTITSWAHLKGLFQEIHDFLREYGIRPLHHHKAPHEDSWVLIDCGNFIVHLMDREVREFYELEKLWFQGKKVAYSSKSSKSSPSS